MGFLLLAYEPTKPMRDEAAQAGFKSESWGTFPKLQIRTVEDLFGGKPFGASAASGDGNEGGAEGATAGTDGVGGCG